MTDNIAKKIADLNDAFRQNPHGQGRVYVTAGVNAQSPEFVAAAFRRVREFSDFNPNNDPYLEQNFGNFELAGKKVYFKVDYYDNDCKYGSEDPSDPGQTTRVLTIMLAEEY